MLCQKHRHGENGLKRRIYSVGYLLLDERQITTNTKAQSDLLTQKSMLNMVSTAKNKLCLLFQCAIYFLMDAKQRIFK